MILYKHPICGSKYWLGATAARVSPTSAINYLTNWKNIYFASMQKTYHAVRPTLIFCIFRWGFPFFPYKHDTLQVTTGHGYVNTFNKNDEVMTQSCDQLNSLGNTVGIEIFRHPPRCIYHPKFTSFSFKKLLKGKTKMTTFDTDNNSMITLYLILEHFASFSMLSTFVS